MPSMSSGRRSRAGSPLIRVIGKRILTGIVTLVCVSMLVFIATQALPSDPAHAILGRSATPESLAALRKQLHLDEPVVTQYLDWVGGALHGDLGKSVGEISQPSV